MVTKVEEYIKARQAENAPTTTTPTAKEQIRSRNENIRAETMGNTAISGQQNVKTEPKVATPTPVTTQPPKTPEMTKAEQSKPQNNLVGNRDVRQEIFTRNRLAGTATGEAVVRGVMEGKIGNDELEYIQQTNPQLYQDYLASRKTQKDLTMVNTPLAGRFDFGGDEELSGALNILGQIQQDAISRMASLAGTIDRSQLYDEYLNTPELQEKETKFNEIQKEAMELRNTMANTLDDVRSEYEGKASESYIQAVAAKRNAVLQKRLDQIEDDLWFAQTDYNSALSSAERKFGFELADRQEEVARQEQLIQTQLNMSMQQFQMGWEVLLLEKEQEQKQYWNQKEFEDKVTLMGLQKELDEDTYANKLALEYKYASMGGYDSSDFIELDNGNLYNVKTNEVLDIMNLGTGTGFSPSGTNYVDSLGTVTAYGSETEINGKKVGWKRGLDIAGEENSNIPTGFAGTVKVGNDPEGFGNYVKVTMDDGSTVQYSHLNNVLVSDGDRISAGTIVGTMGNTGFTIPMNGGKGVHVDITMKDKNGNYISPQDVEKLHNMQSASPQNYKEDLVFDAQGIILQGTADQQDSVPIALGKAIEKGDKKMGFNILSGVLQKSMGTQFRQAKALRTTMATYLDEIETSIKGLSQVDGGLQPFIEEKPGELYGYDSEGNFGFLPGTREAIMEKIGQTSDPDINRLQITMLDFLDQLARARTGAAMTPSEEAFYTRLLPSLGKDVENNLSTIDGLRDSLRIGDKAEKILIASQLGDGLNERLFGDDKDLLSELGIFVPDFEEDVNNSSELDLFMSKREQSLGLATDFIPRMF